MGMEKEIPTCGIFSELEDKENEELDDVPEMEAIEQKENYKSMMELKEDAEQEIQRYVDKGFAIVKPLKWAQDLFEKGTVSIEAGVRHQDQWGQDKEGPHYSGLTAVPRTCEVKSAGAHSTSEGHGCDQHG